MLYVVSRGWTRPCTASVPLTWPCECTYLCCNRWWRWLPLVSPTDTYPPKRPPPSTGTGAHATATMAHTAPCRLARVTPTKAPCCMTFNALISTLALLGTAVRWLWVGANCGDGDALKVTVPGLQNGRYPACESPSTHNTCPCPLYQPGGAPEPVDPGTRWHVRASQWPRAFQADLSNTSAKED